MSFTAGSGKLLRWHAVVPLRIIHDDIVWFEELFVLIFLGS